MRDFSLVPCPSKEIYILVSRHPTVETQDTSKAELSLLNSPRRNARNCTLGKLHSFSTNKRPNTDGPPLQDRTPQSSYT